MPSLIKTIRRHPFRCAFRMTIVKYGTRGSCPQAIRQRPYWVNIPRVLATGILPMLSSRQVLLTPGDVVTRKYAKDLRTLDCLCPKLNLLMEA